ncbi:hypothetical protein D1Y75_01585 [Riemerella anatipestifer]|nr:hypothetical protein [Riemerella anatipestifer]
MKRIRNILKNKDYKALIENIVSLGVLQFVNLVLPLLVLPYSRPARTEMPRLRCYPRLPGDAHRGNG